MSESVSHQLPAEMWAVVIRHLLRPRPNPRKEHDWSELHQGDLAKCARVSKLFHDLTISILYEEPMFDNFCKLLYPIIPSPQETKPVSFDIPRKLASLKNVRKLHISHPNVKDYGVYYAIFIGVDLWSTAGTTNEAESAGIDLIQYHYPLAFYPISKLPAHERHMFPNIQCISINTWGPILQDPIWESLHWPTAGNEHYRYRSLLQTYHNIGINAHRFLALDNTPQTVCSRGLTGPINIAHYHQAKGNQSFRFLHFIFHQIDHMSYNSLPHSIGRHVQLEYTNFVAQHPSQQDHETMATTSLTSLAIDFNEMVEGMKTMIPGDPDYRPDEKLQEDISNTMVVQYGYLQKEDMDEKGATDFADMLQKAFDQQSRTFKGKFLFYPLHAVPDCISCGYRV